MVPRDLPTIQAALDDARAGDTVQVRPGTYVETLRFPDGVVLRGTSAAETKLILPTGAKHAVLVRGISSGSIENLTIAGDPSAPGRGNADAPDGVVVVGSTFTFRDCRITDLPGNGMIVSGASDVTLKACEVLRNGRCGLTASIGTVTLESACSLSDNRSSGLVARGTTVRVWTARCHDNGENGIDVQGPNGVLLVRESACNRNGGDGLRIRNGVTGEVQSYDGAGNQHGVYVTDDEERVTFTECTAVNNTAHGFTIRNTRGTVLESCTAADNHALGFEIDRGSRSITMRDCKAERNGTSGVSIFDGSAATLEQNTASGNANDGIRINGKRTEVDLIGNTCNDNHERGLNIWASTVTIRGTNRFVGNTFEGIIVGGGEDNVAAVEITDSTVCSKSVQGINVVSFAVVTIDSAVCNDNSDNGIIAGSATTHITVSNSTCNGNKNGICLLNGLTEGSLIGNTCHHNNKSDWGCGIIAGLPSSTFVIRSNDCRSNTGDGIHLYGQGNRCIVEKNICIANLNGLGVNGMGKGVYPKVSRNTFNANTRNGIIMLNGADGVFDTNIVSNNREYGMYLDDASDFDVPRGKRNTVQGNGKGADNRNN